MARALITDPQIVLADEPTGAPDSQSFDNLLELFGLYDVGLFALCTAGTLTVFTAVYALVYGLTARTYERIVGGAM